MNLLPKSVVFIDDNPVERASIKAAFPEMRVIGSNPYLWRRILLWAPETQVANVTTESAKRTEMIQAQVERETQRKKLSRADFLANLQVRATLTEVASVDHKHFPRALELINKTNQFNTTGKRWTHPEFVSLFANGGRIFTLEVTDKFTPYGIVGVLVTQQNEISQFVLSCRVIGMDVEIAAVLGVARSLAEAGHATCEATLQETAANLLCRDLWERCGFEAVADGRYSRSVNVGGAVPPHVHLERKNAGVIA